MNCETVLREKFLNEALIQNHHHQFICQSVQLKTNLTKQHERRPFIFMEVLQEDDQR